MSGGTTRRAALVGLGAALLAACGKGDPQARLEAAAKALQAAIEARHTGDVMSRFGSQDTILQAISNELVESVLDGVAF